MTLFRGLLPSGLTALGAFALLASGAAQTTVTKASFGKTPEGAEVSLYTLTDRSLKVQLMSFGAHLVSIDAPDRAGKMGDVLLGFDTLDGFLADKSTYMGSVVGRYGNRIAKGSFPLDGKTVQVTPNSKGNALHGGLVGFDRRNWTGRIVPSGVEFTLVSPDGDQGFPGKLTAHVRYTLAGKRLKLDYTATTDEPTVINLTNHSYFNLAGAGDVLGYTLMLQADRFTPVDARLIPTGELAPVAGTPFDFRTATPIGARINASNEQLTLAGGYDHNFVLDAPVGKGTGVGLHLAAKVVDPGSGRTLTVSTTEPGVQFYTGNFLDGTVKGRSGAVYQQHAGFCLETQHFPDSPNHPSFPTTTLLPGKTYRSTTVFEFSVAK